MSSDPNPASWPSRLCGWCLLILLAAVALDQAVRILAGIWPWLAAIGLGISGAMAIVWWRRRW